MERMMYVLLKNNFNLEPCGVMRSYNVHKRSRLKTVRRTVSYTPTFDSQSVLPKD
jgi:hypothetical protein